MFGWLRRQPLGVQGERRARRYLQKLGYRHLASNYTVRQGEIDLIMQDGATLVFVEVKTRRQDHLADAALLVNGTKRRRIIAAARHFLRKKKVATCPLRFDVVTVIMDQGQAPTIRHYPGAFHP